MNPYQSIDAELGELNAHGLRRALRAIDGPQGPELIVDGKRVVNFCSNDYLGLAAHPALRAAAHSTIDEVGVGAAASRLIGGNFAAHRELEATLSEWLGVERALAFNSGYQANVGLLSALAGPDDVIFSDQLNHASIIDGCRLSRARVKVYPHVDFAALTHLIDAHAGRRRLIVTESLFSMDGDTVDLGRLRKIADRANALLIVDDAHAIGALGTDGRGLAVEFADATVGTFGKGLGSFGAFVSGRASLVELVLQRARSFVFSTALPALITASSAAALELARGQDGASRRARLAANVERFCLGLRNLGIRTSSLSHIQPIFTRDGEPESAMRLSRALLEAGLFVHGIRPPTVPRGTSRLRVTLMSEHDTSHVDRLVTALGHARSQLRGENDV